MDRTIVTIRLDAEQQKLLDELEALHSEVFQREIKRQDLIALALGIGLRRDVSTLRRTKALLQRIAA